jgi:cell division protein FtsL
MAMAARSTWIEAWEGDLVPSAASRRSASRVGARSTSARYYGREATARVPQPSPQTERMRPLPKPRLVTRRMPQWRMIAVALLFAATLLGVAIVTPMLLSSGVAEVESQVGRMESNQTQLSASIAALSSQISALSAPDRVAEQAAQLGLKPADKVHYLQSGAAGTEGDTTVAGR